MAISGLGQGGYGESGGGSPHQRRPDRVWRVDTAHFHVPHPSTEPDGFSAIKFKLDKTELATLAARKAALLEQFAPRIAALAFAANRRNSPDKIAALADEKAKFQAALDACDPLLGFKRTYRNRFVMLDTETKAHQYNSCWQTIPGEPGDLNHLHLVPLIIVPRSKVESDTICTALRENPLVGPANILTATWSLIWRQASDFSDLVNPADLWALRAAHTKVK